MKLVAAFTPNMPLGIEKITGSKRDDFRNQLYLVGAIGTEADGTLYLLTQNDKGDMVWLSAKDCTFGRLVQQQSPLAVPGRSMKLA